MAERSSRAPALIISALLHAAILGSTLIAWPWGTKLKPVEVTPVTLLTAADVARLSAAEQSVTPETAQTPDPVPEAPAAPVAETPDPVAQPAPAPKPAPLPPAPTPAAKPPVLPKPAPTPTAKPSPAKPTPAARNQKPVNLDDLAQSLTQSNRRPTGAPRSSVDQGELDRIARDLANRRAEGRATATAVSGRAMIGQEIEARKLWRLNCGVPGASEVSVRIRIVLNRDGTLAQRSQPADYPSIDAIPDPVVKAAASLAVSAVGAGAPYKGLPEDDYPNWRNFVLRFEGKKTCNGSN